MMAMMVGRLRRRLAVAAFTFAWAAFTLAIPAGAVVNSVLLPQTPYQQELLMSPLPAFTCGSGSVAGYTSPANYFTVISSIVFYNIDVAPTGAGTCSGTITIINLPVNVRSTTTQVFPCQDKTTGAILVGYNTAATHVQVFTASGGNPTAGDEIICTGSYQY